MAIDPGVFCACVVDINECTGHVAALFVFTPISVAAKTHTKVSRLIDFTLLIDRLRI